MGKKFRVTVEQIDTDVPFKDREYQQIGKKPNGDDRFDYVYFDSVKDVETTVYDQTVEELNLADLVSVVNKLGDK